MEEKLLSHNLNNISQETDLFGQTTDKLSMRDRIGFVPISIWQPDWTKTKRLKEIIGDSGQTRELMGGSSNTVFDGKRNASVFNPHLAQMILSAYCPTSAKIYDPFAGGGTRGFIAVSMGHKYAGLEVREAEVLRLLTKMQELKRGFTIYQGDAQKYPYKKDYFDFCYTCPPYYNLEIYSDLKDDLSNAPTYQKFLEMLERCMRGVYMGLKTNALSVWVVGNFRDKQGYLVHFNGDVIRLGQQVGFKLHDELVFWGASGSAAQRAGMFEANRKAVRVHEYIVILKK